MVKIEPTMNPIQNGLKTNLDSPYIVFCRLSIFAFQSENGFEGESERKMGNCFPLRNTKICYFCDLDVFLSHLLQKNAIILQS